MIVKNDTSTELHYIGELLAIIGKIFVLLWFIVWIAILFSTSPGINTYYVNLMGVCGILAQTIGYIMSSVFRVRKNTKYSSDLQTNLEHVDYVCNCHNESCKSSSTKTHTHDFIDKTCPDCNGTGRCRWCKGTGKWGWTGLVHTTEIKCNQCYGEGVCRTCGGTGIRKL